MKESKLWFLHVLAGGCLVVLLGIHTLIMHYDTVLVWLNLSSGNPLSFGSVLHRMQALSHTVIYMLLLLVGLYHGLYGMRSMIWEINFPTRGKQAVSYLLILVGLVVAAWGSYTILKGHFAPPLGG